MEAVAALLKHFLGLEEMQRRRQQKEEAEYGEEEDSLDNSSDSDEDDNGLWFIGTLTDSFAVTLYGLSKGMSFLRVSFTCMLDC